MMTGLLIAAEHENCSALPSDLDLWAFDGGVHTFPGEDVCGYQTKM